MNRTSSLPPITQYPNMNAQRLESINNLNNLYSNYTTQRSQSANEQTTFLLNEIKNIKQIIKTQFANQTELQNKIIEYNRIISEQEKIIRLNNSKLNEHDSKLTEVLISFNNYLKFQEKTSKIVNLCQDKIDKTVVKIEDFSELKNLVFNLKQNFEGRINNLYNSKDEFLIKLSENIQDNKNTQQYILDKLQSFQEKTDNSLNSFQSNNIQNFQNQKDNFTLQINQAKGLTQLVEINLSEETKARKVSIEKIYTDMQMVNKSIDDKFSKFEKNLLETEKNLINLNKDYMTQFKVLINKNKEGTNTEIKSLRSLFEAGLIKTHSDFEGKISTLNKYITSIKEDINQNRILTEEIKLYVKENVKSISERMEQIESLLNSSTKEHSAISLSLKEIKKQNEELIEKKINDLSNEFNDRLTKETNEIKTDISIQTDKNKKRIDDLFDQNSKIQILINQLKDYKVDLSGYIQKENFNSKMKEIDSKIEEIEKVSKSELENATKEIKKKLKQKLAEFSNSTDDAIRKKFNLMEKDFNEKIDKEKELLEGKIGQKVIEAENLKFENIVKEQEEMKKALEQINLQNSEI